MKKIIGVFIIEIASFILVFVLTMNMKYVTGVAVNSDGFFAVGISCLNSDNRHDLLFYNSECVLINSKTIYKRGGIEIGNYNDLLIVQDGVGISRTFDYYGNDISDVSYNEVINSRRYYISEEINLYYNQDFFGNEHIYYTTGNKSVLVDIGYDYYRNEKIKKAITFFIILSIVLNTGLYVLKKYRILKVNF